MEDEDLANMTLYGMLRAAGCPSTDHKDSLKRSARPAISLLRYLCLEFDQNNAKNLFLGELNGFGQALCALNVPQLRTLRLDIHIGKGDNESGSRGGSKDDACHLCALILARHTDTDYETPKPINIKDVLPAGETRAEFENWLASCPSVTSEVRRMIQENISAAAGGGRKKVGTDAVAAAATNAASAQPLFNNENSDHGDDDDVLGVFGKQSVNRKQSKSLLFDGDMDGGVEIVTGLGGGTKASNADGKPTQWSQTQMASATERASISIFLEEERERTIKEKKRLEGQKQRLLGRDPLGIKGSTTDSNREAQSFDLREIDTRRSDLIQQALNEIEEEIEEELALVADGGVDQVNWLETQRQALIAIAEENKSNGASILPTDPRFDPFLFLTLVHRNASYQELQDSTSRLSRKTDNQVERLQNLVRENFDLFIKCSEGIDIFADGQDDGISANEGMQKLQKRFRALDGIAESCSDQAKKSFKPLLDNTNQVRKVQSALSVLQRVAPLLQVPSLMRQHIENADFSSVVKAYRKVLVIDKDHCDVDLLRYVRAKATESAQEARSDLELILADETSSAGSLLDAIRDLSELISLLEGEDSDDTANKPKTGDGKTPRAGSTRPGTFSIDRHIICVRDYPPAMSCLLLQISHFRSLVEKHISATEALVDRIFRGEGADGSPHAGRESASDLSSSEHSSSQRSRDKRWKIDVLDTRVDATSKAVNLAKNWLPRLLQIGLATEEAEKRRIARKSRSGGNQGSESEKETTSRSAFELFKTIVGPALMRLHEHAAFCALGVSNQGSAYKIGATFGRSSAERLRAILQSPLPPTQTAKCALELAVLAEAIQEANDAMISIRPETNNEKAGSKKMKSYHSPLEKCYALASDVVVMIERRVCIYSFDACSRKLAANASGNGTFDGASFLACVQKLSDDLTRPDECATEVEKGCVLVVTKCCEGLTNYVKDRSDAARLRVVAECADALNTIIGDVVREVSYLTNDQSETLETSLSSVVSTLEGEMFDVYLESVKKNVESCARLGLIDEGESTTRTKADEVTPFPPYLAASFLSIVRCRAQVERALREATVRNAEGNGSTYLFLALQTASDGIVENICLELKAKLTRIRPTKADSYASHLQFLINTLKKYLSEETLALASDTRRMLLSKAGAKRHGPEGLSGLENLERLGRVYVMCLNE